jgi:hypothetical protein
LAGAILVVHRAPPIRRAKRKIVGIGFDLIAISVATTRALIAIDAPVIERPASPNAIFPPTNPVCDLFDVRAAYAGQYKLSRCVANWTGLRVRSQCRQNENRGRTRQPRFSCHDDLLAVRRHLFWQEHACAAQLRPSRTQASIQDYPQKQAKKYFETSHKVQTKWPRRTKH